MDDMALRAKRKTTYSPKAFYLDDLPSTLFPLNTNRVLVERGAEQISAFAAALASSTERSFLPQRRVHANKDKFHLRRTIKLDVVAEYYLYELVHRNRDRFRKPHVPERRRHFGYRFEDGLPLSASRSYASFRSEVFNSHIGAEEFIAFDVANFFNNVYHHDLHAWFAKIGPKEQSDVVAFGKFFREINAGRTLDCLPQGLYPAKMIGNDFLRFLEESSALKARKMLRFMDDVVILGDDANELQADFTELQRLLGLKGLSVNAAKTRTEGSPWTDEVDDHVDDLKKRLLRRRRSLIISRYDRVEADSVQAPLAKKEIDYIVELLGHPTLGEDDAELIMVVMRDHVDRIADRLELFADGFPHLAKNFYSLCREATDKERVAEVVLKVASEGSHIGEYQLFWFGVMLEDYLLETALAPDIIRKLYTHASATDISRAKILEISDQRYGLPEMRETFLREGRSDWLAWASAAGARAMDKQARNYLLSYFQNGSEMNKLIADILQQD